MSGFLSSDFATFGTPIVVSRLLGTTRTQVRFPRSKCRRIRRKWAKDPRNWRESWVRACYRFGDTIVCDPITYAELASLTSPAVGALEQA